MTTNNKPFSIGWFAREILGKPLYWYQELIGDAILASIRGGHGHTFTIMLSRQMGKNQLSAVLYHFAICCKRNQRCWVVSMMRADVSDTEAHADRRNTLDTRLFSGVV